jgi:hypothetical protein
VGIFSRSQGGQERRKGARKDSQEPAWIDTGAKPLIPCILLDVADGGARLTADHPEALPDDFTLLLSADGSDSRRCRVAWRAGAEVGVEYLSFPHYILP